MLALASSSYRLFHAQILSDRSFILDPKIHTLIVGDSHPQVGVDPSIIPGSMNIAQSAEGYLFSYYKLRFFLDKNHGISNIILGFSYHNLAKKYQEGFLFDKKETPTTYNKYFVLLDEEGKRITRSLNPDYLVNWLNKDFGLPLHIYKDNLLQKKLLQQPYHPEDFEFFGGFDKREQSNIDPEVIKKKVKRYYLDSTGHYSGISPLMLSYLHKILKLCQKKHITVSLLNTPLLDIYQNQIPPEAIEKYQAIKIDLLAQYKNVMVLDLAHQPLPHHYFLDGDHINALGARVVSQIAAKALMNQRKSPPH